MDAIYVRTSTDDNEGHAQLHECRRLTKSRDWPEPKVYLDLGESGVKASRPQWDEILRLARVGKLKRLICTELARLGRKLSVLLLQLDELRECGVELVIIRQGIDFSTPAGRLMAHMLAAFAEFERELARERTRAGIARARTMGVSIGRPKRNIDGQIVLNLRAQGLSWRQIGQKVGVAPATALRAARGVLKTQN